LKLAGSLLQTFTGADNVGCIALRGDAWGDAKKCLEMGDRSGEHPAYANGSKRTSPEHGAARVGNAVDDPSLNTARPSLQELIWLLSRTSAGSRISLHLSDAPHDKHGGRGVIPALIA
jgi:Na+/H+-translocating membrane pyrophosphatase